MGGVFFVVLIIGMGFFEFCVIFFCFCMMNRWFVLIVLIVVGVWFVSGNVCVDCFDEVVKY